MLFFVLSVCLLFEGSVSEFVVDLKYYPVDFKLFWLVFYYQGDAPDKLVKYFNFAKIFLNATNVRFGKIDCIKQDSLCETEGYECGSFMKIFLDGFAMVYEEEFEVRSMEKWLRKAMAENGEFIKTLQLRTPLPKSENVMVFDLKAACNDFWIVMYYKDHCLCCRNLNSVFNTIALQLKDTPRLKFGRVQCSLQELEHISSVKHVGIYGNKFYKSQVSQSLRSARALLREVIGFVKPLSVCDVGCGTGAWLKAFQEITRIDDNNAIGFDFEVPLESLLINPTQYRNTDVSQPFTYNRKFDLCISLEVAEHISSSDSNTFIKSLVCLAPVVLFSAAVPGQMGTHHINEQWPSYWEERFKKHHYFAVDCLRRKIWGSKDILGCYKQNVVFYVREDKLSQLGLIREKEPLLPLIHPDVLSYIVKEISKNSSKLRRKKLFKSKRKQLDVVDMPSKKSICNGKSVPSIEAVFEGSVVKYPGELVGKRIYNWILEMTGNQSILMK